MSSPSRPPPKPGPSPGSEAPSITYEPIRYRDGDTIAGKYRLESLLGQGGMGSVWRARNLALDADVAVKLVHFDQASDDSDERLQREAHAAAKLEHPSIVRVFDFGHTDLGDPFIVMELLRGESLRERLEQHGRIAPGELIPLLLPVLGAVAAAHEAGIVHRDLKPDNVVVVDRDGQLTPKVVDFGIAKVTVKGGSEHATRDGTILGSPEYMSPEQARGDISAIDARSDVWALGVVLYEALAGVTPFTASHPLALLRSIIEEDVPDLPSDAEVDPELAAIVRRALAKAPADRYPNARALGAALARWALGTGLQTDVTGASISAHWLGTPRGASSHDLQGRASLRSRGDLQAPTLPETDRPSVTHSDVSYPTPTPSRARVRAAWVVGAASTLIGVGVTGFLLRAGVLGPPFEASSATESTLPTPSDRPHGATGVATAVHAPGVSGAARVPDVPARVAAPVSSPVDQPAVLGSTLAAQPVVVPNVVTPSISASLAAPPSVTACVATLFTAGAFTDDADLGALCQQADPRAAAVELRGAIARRGLIDQTTTGAMRQWAMLSWYELAAAVVARHLCCAPEQVTEVDLPPSVGTCEQLGPVLDGLGRAAQRGDDVTEHVASFRRVAGCIERGHRLNPSLPSPYAYKQPLGSGDEATFLRLLERARKAAPGALPSAAPGAPAP